MYRMLYLMIGLPLIVSAPACAASASSSIAVSVTVLGPADPGKGQAASHPEYLLQPSGKLYLVKDTGLPGLYLEAEAPVISQTNMK